MTITVTPGVLQEKAAEASTSVPFPGTVTSGALLLVFGTVNTASGTNTTTPSGWTQQVQQANSGNTQTPQIYIATKNTRATGSEGGTSQAFAHGSVVSAWQSFALDGVDTSTPFDIAIVIVDNAATQTTTTFSSQTVATAGALGLVLCGANSTLATSTEPSGWTKDGDRTTGSRAYHASHKAGFSAGASGSIVVTWLLSGTPTALRNIGALIFLRPAGTTWTTSGTCTVTTTFAAAATRTGFATGALTVTTTATAAATRTEFTAGTALAVSNSIAAAAVRAGFMAERTRLAAASLAVTTTIGAAAQRTLPTDAALPVITTVAASAEAARIVQATGALPVTTTIIADALRTTVTGAHLTVTTSRTATAERTRFAAAALSLTATIHSAAQRVTLTPTLALPVTTSVTATALRTTRVTATALPVVTTIAATNTLIHPAHVIIGGIEKPVMSRCVIAGGVKRPIVGSWVVIGGVKHPCHI
jgi:hypothetical protein